MTALGKLLRTTAFKLTLAYLIAFVAFAIFVIGYVAWNAARVLEAQITETIETEINSLAEQYRIGGPRRLLSTIERRGRQPGSFLYVVSDARGEGVSGNASMGTSVQSLPPGWRELAYTRPDETPSIERLAKVRIFLLPSGFRLLVGRDLEERQRLAEVFRRARLWSVALAVLLGGVAAAFITRRVLRRVDAIGTASRHIMDGNLGERLPISGVGDEFDRLAQSLNQMLDRIGELMTGLREVSDNIAHDLRTPLTRLRNGAEEALRTATTRDDYRAALERTIGESDELMKVFDALLMIARAEAGSLSSAMTVIDAGDVARNVAELYEPVAEEAGMPIKVEIAAGQIVRASRELLSQALSNLIDNALKYGHAEKGAAGEISLSVADAGEQVELAVADRGAGIPTADRERVLERFVRLEKSRASAGSGLGLALVAAVARLHNGAVRLDDNRPGLRIVLSLPRVQPQA